MIFISSHFSHLVYSCGLHDDGQGLYLLYIKFIKLADHWIIPTSWQHCIQSWAELHFPCHSVWKLNPKSHLQHPAWTDFPVTYLNSFSPHFLSHSALAFCSLFSYWNTLWNVPIPGVLHPSFPCFNSSFLRHLQSSILYLREVFVWLLTSQFIFP